MDEDQEKVRLEIVGITYNQIETGVYAIVLQELGGERRVPIIIGAAEAQAIECKLQDIKVPRPLTHDLLGTILGDFGISLRYVWIHKLKSGVFAADLHLWQGDREVVVDSRSSDAIALAVRTGAPIYTSEELVREVGFERAAHHQKLQPTAQNAPETDIPEETERTLDDFSDEELLLAMQEASENEDYERAAEIKAILDKRKKP